MKYFAFSASVLFAAAAVAADGVDTEALLRQYVARFNADDVEYYTNAIPNVAAEKFLMENCPRFACPDKDIERTYYFRWWTYRKHLRKAPAGEWVVTEFLPDVGWAGYGNTISCPFIHHVREGRWLRNSDYIRSHVATILAKGKINGPDAYAAPPAWGALQCAEISGDYKFPESQLATFVENYEKWEKGWEIVGLSLRDMKTPTHYDGPKIATGFKPARGLFDYAGDREGSEFALSVDGARPMINSMMWAEAMSIAALARRKGDGALAKRFEEKAAALEKNIKAKLWNADRKFFTVLGLDGRLDDVCELHGYAPFYFGLPLSSEYATSFAALTDEKGFAGPLGLTFPRRDTPGFDNSVNFKTHECLWNGPSWPYATSVALTGFAKSLHSSPSPSPFASLLSQYARQHQRKREDGKIVPWIDENVDAFTGMWLSREILLEWKKTNYRNCGGYLERGKDYNHSTFCDIVISGLVGFVPEPSGFSIKPLFPRDWDYLQLDNLRYRGHDISLRWNGKSKTMTVTVDGELRSRVLKDDCPSVAFALSPKGY